MYFITFLMIQFVEIVIYLTLNPATNIFTFIFADDLIP